MFLLFRVFNMCLKYALKILVLSFLLISCSGIKETKPNDPTTENPGNGTTTGTVGVADPGNKGAEGSTHWILLVPFQRMEAGSFMMGSPESERYRLPNEDQVEVTITQPFEIMIYEVTQSQWVKVMGSNPSVFKLQEHCDDYTQGMCPNNPVELVSWNDVQEFIRKLNDSLGLSGCDGTPNSAKGCYRLPTEAEWEYSARAGTTTAHFLGDNPRDLEDYAWYKDNSDRQTHKVGLKKPNPKGLYDIYGNVWEWLQDSYVDSLPGGTDPLTTAIKLYRPFRGGSYANEVQKYLRAAFRTGGRLVYKSSNVGFRLVRT